MAQQSTTHQPSDFVSLLQAVVGLTDQPAALVDVQGLLLSYNTPWAETVIDCAEDDDADEVPPTLADCLVGFQNSDVLQAQLSDNLGAQGSCVVRRIVSKARRKGEACEFRVRWRWLATETPSGGCLLVLLTPLQTDHEAERLITAQRVQIERLLVRQSLIEESERRRIGQVLHDVVVQDLALIHRWAKSCFKEGHGDAEILPTIDRMIETVRKLMYDLSPPILNEIGLFAALQWLGGHLGNHYHMKVSVNVNASSEPELSDAVKTIFYRSVRELIINAAKHASVSSLNVDASDADGQVRVVVSDKGCGFDPNKIHGFGPEASGYGLLSVERQVHGIGGGFELVSSVGGGTRVTLTVPLSAAEDMKRG